MSGSELQTRRFALWTELFDTSSLAAYPCQQTDETPEGIQYSCSQKAVKLPPLIHSIPFRLSRIAFCISNRKGVFHAYNALDQGLTRVPTHAMVPATNTTRSLE